MHNWKKGLLWVLSGLLFSSVIAVIHWHCLDRDWSAFILLSDNNIDPATFNEKVKIYPHAGYDGQFFYALALRPFERIVATASHPRKVRNAAEPYSEIKIDNPPLRTKRIGYPLLAWVANGFGQGQHLPFALVLINVLGIGLAIGACFLFIRAFEAPAYYCLLPLTFIGTWICLYRDLADHLGVAMGLLSLYFLLNKKTKAYALVGIAAMLTKETVVFILLGGAIVAGLTALRQRQVGKIFLLGLPFLVYFLWSTFLSWNAPSDGTLLKHFDWPFAGMVRGYAANPPLPLFWLCTLVPVILISLEGLYGLWKPRLSSLTQPIAIVFLLNLTFMTILSKAIYEDPFSFARNLLPMQYTALLILMQQKQRVSWLTLLVCLSTAGIFLWRSVINP
jgi:hypothetical protein